MTINRRRRRFVAIAATLILTRCITVPVPPGSGVETIVLMRHGEKPERGLGQLTCQGLNRALALPARLERFAKPAAIFAPDPSCLVPDIIAVPPGLFSYVRPFETIEPTAIDLGMPVNTDHTYVSILPMQRELQSVRYENATVFVAWEHNMLTILARALMQDAGGGGGLVPSWRADDYDSLYIVEITRTNQGTSAKFHIERECLNDQPSSCPTSLAPPPKLSVVRKMH